GAAAERMDGKRPGVLAYMKGINTDARPRGLLHRILARAFDGRAVARLSAVIDRQLGAADSSTDQTVTALLQIGAGRPMPSDQRERSWALLDRELFDSQGGRNALSIPFRSPGLAASLGAVMGRRGFVVVASGMALLVGLGAWRGPYVAGEQLRRQLTTAWAQVRAYDGDVQFVSFVPGYQIQWNGRVECETPDRERIEYDVLGYPVTIVSRGRAAAIDSRLGGVNARGVGRLRFLARMLRADELVDLITHAGTMRREGAEEVLGQPCTVLFFAAPGRVNEASWDENTLERSLPRGVVSGRVWLFRRTLLPAQVEMYSPGGRVAFSYRFTRLAINPSMSPLRFNIPRPDRGGGRISLRRTIIPLDLAGE
ncbi:MAG: hypothetical protein LC772_06010, partial [Chloroflexi bacterium]|nr:hypothetical protein [Chloroflexota bacterium]